MSTPQAGGRRRVYLHIGLPKSGTSFLQSTLRANAERLRPHGVFYPTQQRRGLFHAALDLTDNHPGWGQPDELVAGTWAEICGQVRAFDGTAVLSNELFCNIKPERIAGALAELDGHEVHVVVTARDLARQLPAEWQEGIKHGRSGSFARFLDLMLDPERSSHYARLFWRHQDLSLVLGHWLDHLPASRIHVVTCPLPGAPPELLWQRFCQVVGLDPDLAELPTAGVNTSLGITEIDLLRRVNRSLDSSRHKPRTLRRTMKQYFVRDILRRHTSTKVSTPASVVPRLREITQAWCVDLTAAGYDVVGDLDELVPALADPDRLAADPGTPEAAPDEVLSLAADAIAELVSEVQRLRRRNRRLSAELEDRDTPVGRELATRVLGRLRR